MKEDLRTYTLQVLRDRMERDHLDAYRGDQIFKWIWQKNACDFDHMTNLSKELRKTLTERFMISRLSIEKIVQGKDQAQKFLFSLHDDERIEAVYIPEERRRTICVSTQIGCPLKCSFCATGLMGFTRNLAAHEIADQVRTIQETIGQKATNVVFMGMGEPLLNTKHVFDAIDILCSPMGLGISQRHMTVSTIGILPGMTALLESPCKIKLAISLNFPDQKQREAMMPGTRQYPLDEVLRSALRYSRQRTMVTFEYVLIRSVNDSIGHAKALLGLIKDMPSKINIIPYNPHPRLPFQAPSEDTLMRFQDVLLDSPHVITMRRSRGLDISAACGQLVIPPETK
ncbi:23S rRNA (adenine(2503)-C(2))-methyltransferase RlmN [candidate division WOR-3 bacterium]|nr:23S rRNA (adenine(2503)-C(2))-methyltransferase RlmN [candidate division WOR-3 bacterium]